MNDTKKYLEQYGAKIQESISFLGSISPARTTTFFPARR